MHLISSATFRFWWWTKEKGIESWTRGKSEEKVSED